MIKVAYLTGTRADFGLMRLILKRIKKEKGFRLLLFVTGMHLLKEFGETIKEVKKEFKIAQIINATCQEDNRLSMALFVGKCLEKTATAFAKYKPDLLLVLGDRGEQLAAATAAAYLQIPIIHFHGGELSGTVDNPVRHAISSSANFHFAPTKQSAQRLANSGINPETIFVVGAPGIEEVKNLPKGIKKNQIVVLQHPAENEKQAGQQMATTLKAALSFQLPIYVIYPNADAGGRKMIKVIKKFAQKHSLIKIFPSLSRDKFLGLLNQSSVLVGNSSAGLIEAPSLHLPVINIGERQQNRERAKNVIDVGYNIKQIKQAIKKSLFDKNFQKSLLRINNPYDQGETSRKVLRIIKEKFQSFTSS